MSHKLLGILSLSFLLSGLFSCTGEKKAPGAGEGGTAFKINLSPSEGLKDPLFNLDQERLKVLSLVFDPLLTYSSNATASGGEIVPVLLADLPTLSADQLTYTFKLKNVPFHSSPKLGKDRVVTSKDVLMSLLRGVTGDDSSNYGNLLTGMIDGLTAWTKSTDTGEWYGKKLPRGFQIKNDSEFSIKLMRKYPDFLALLTLPAFSVIPHELISGSNLTEAIGTGPYHFVDTTLNSKNWTLDGNSALKFSRVEISESTETADIKAADYTSLNLKLAAQLIDPTNGNLKDLPDHTLQELKVRRLEMLVFNLKDPMIKALGADFRKAMLAALNVDAIMGQMYRGFSLKSAQFVPPGVEGALEDNGLKKMSVEEATKKIQKTLGKKTLKILYPQSAAYWINELQKNLETLGAHFEFEAVEASSYLERIEKGQFQIAPLSWEGDLPEATNFLQLYYSGSQINAQNLSGYKSAAFDAAFDKLSKLFPSPERKKLAEDAHKIVLKDLPALPLGYKKDFAIVGKRAGGLNTKAFGASSLKDFLLAR